MSEPPLCLFSSVFLSESSPKYLPLWCWILSLASGRHINRRRTTQCLLHDQLTTLRSRHQRHIRCIESYNIMTFDFVLAPYRINRKFCPISPRWVVENLDKDKVLFFKKLFHGSKFVREREILWERRSNQVKKFNKMSLPLPAAACRKKKKTEWFHPLSWREPSKERRKKTVMFPSDHYERDGWSYARSLAC